MTTPMITGDFSSARLSGKPHPYFANVNSLNFGRSNGVVSVVDQPRAKIAVNPIQYGDITTMANNMACLICGAATHDTPPLSPVEKAIYKLLNGMDKLMVWFQSKFSPPKKSTTSVQPTPQSGFSFATRLPLQA